MTSVFAHRLFADTNKCSEKLFHHRDTKRVRQQAFAVSREPSLACEGTDIKISDLLYT
jgi:hypothetical protein